MYPLDSLKLSEWSSEILVDFRLLPSCIDLKNWTSLLNHRQCWLSGFLLAVDSNTKSIRQWHPWIHDLAITADSAVHILQYGSHVSFLVLENILKTMRICKTFLIKHCWINITKTDISRHRKLPILQLRFRWLLQAVSHNTSHPPCLPT